MKLRTTYSGFTDAANSFFDEVIKKVVPHQVVFYEFTENVEVLTFISETCLLMFQLRGGLRKMTYTKVLWCKRNNKQMSHTNLIDFLLNSVSTQFKKQSWLQCDTAIVRWWHFYNLNRYINIFITTSWNAVQGPAAIKNVVNSFSKAYSGYQTLLSCLSCVHSLIFFYQLRASLNTKAFISQFFFSILTMLRIGTRKNLCQVILYVLIYG